MALVLKIQMVKIIFQLNELLWNQWEIMDKKLDKFMKDITANFYKNFELSKGEYDKLE